MSQISEELTLKKSRNIMRKGTFSVQVSLALEQITIRPRSHHPVCQQQYDAAAVLLDIEKASDTARHYGLLYKYELSEFEFPTSPVKLIAPLLIDKRLKCWQ
jgi:hypothetical protein